MKRVKNIYEEHLTLTNLYNVYSKVYKTCKNRDEVFQFNLNKNINLYTIYTKLISGKFVYGRYRVFLIKEPKYRLIMSQYIVDKIVNHFIAEYFLIKYLEPTLIDANIATRKGMGGQKAYKLFEKYINCLRLQKKEIYIMKIDIKKYFYNIDHDILLSMIEKKIKDSKAIDMIKQVLESTNEPYVNEDINNAKSREANKVYKLNITMQEKASKLEMLNKIPLYAHKKGLPIGNMTSQIMAIFYLNEVDHFIKEVLKEKYYIRYMDDLVILGNDVEHLKKIKEIITEKIIEYKLEVNEKSNIFSLSKGVEFLGYKYILRNNKLHIRYNKQTLKRIDKRLKVLKRFDINKYVLSVSSYKGYLCRANTNLYKNKYSKCWSENMRLKEKYDYYRREYEDFILIIREGAFYKTMYDDAIIMWHLFKYKVIKEVASFPLASLDKAVKRLDEYSVNYAVVDEDNVIEGTSDNNNYSSVFNIAKFDYDRFVKVEQISKLLKEKVFKDLAQYDKIIEFIKEL